MRLMPPPPPKPRRVKAEPQAFNGPPSSASEAAPPPCPPPAPTLRPPHRYTEMISSYPILPSSEELLTSPSGMEPPPATTSPLKTIRSAPLAVKESDGRSSSSTTSPSVPLTRCEEAKEVPPQVAHLSLSRIKKVPQVCDSGSLIDVPSAAGEKSSNGESHPAGNEVVVVVEPSPSFPQCGSPIHSFYAPSVVSSLHPSDMQTAEAGAAAGAVAWGSHATAGGEHATSMYPSRRSIPNGGRSQDVYDPSHPLSPPSVENHAKAAARPPPPASSSSSSQACGPRARPTPISVTTATTTAEEEDEEQALQQWARSPSFVVGPMAVPPSRPPPATRVGPASFSGPTTTSRSAGNGSNAYSAPHSPIQGTPYESTVASSPLLPLRVGMKANHPTKMNSSGGGGAAVQGEPAEGERAPHTPTNRSSAGDPLASAGHISRSTANPGYNIPHFSAEELRMPSAGVGRGRPPMLATASVSTASVPSPSPAPAPAPAPPVPSSFLTATQSTISSTPTPPPPVSSTYTAPVVLPSNATPGIPLDNLASPILLKVVQRQLFQQRLMERNTFNIIPPQGRALRLNAPAVTRRQQQQQQRQRSSTRRRLDNLTGEGGLEPRWTSQRVIPLAGSSSSMAAAARRERQAVAQQKERRLHAEERGGGGGRTETAPAPRRNRQGSTSRGSSAGHTGGTSSRSSSSSNTSSRATSTAGVEAVGAAGEPNAAQIRFLAAQEASRRSGNERGERKKKKKISGACSSHPNERGSSTQINQERREEPSAVVHPDAPRPMRRDTVVSIATSGGGSHDQFYSNPTNRHEYIDRLHDELPRARGVDMYGNLIESAPPSLAASCDQSIRSLSSDELYGVPQAYQRQVCSSPRSPKRHSESVGSVYAGSPHPHLRKKHYPSISLLTTDPLLCHGDGKEVSHNTGIEDGEEAAASIYSSSLLHSRSSLVPRRASPHLPSAASYSLGAPHSRSPSPDLSQRLPSQGRESRSNSAVVGTSSSRVIHHYPPSQHRHSHRHRHRPASGILAAITLPLTVRHRSSPSKSGSVREGSISTIEDDPSHPAITHSTHHSRRRRGKGEVGGEKRVGFEEFPSATGKDAGGGGGPHDEEDEYQHYAHRPLILPSMHGGSFHSFSGILSSRPHSGPPSFLQASHDDPPPPPPPPSLLSPGDPKLYASTSSSIFSSTSQGVPSLASSIPSKKKPSDHSSPYAGANVATPSPVLPTS